MSDNNTQDINNPFLLYFNNGIYDLKNSKFTPVNEQCNFNCLINYDYIEYDKNHLDVCEIENFFDTICSNKNDKLMLLLFSASCLEGINKYKKLLNIFGKIYCGKEIYIAMMEYSFDKYFKHILYDDIVNIKTQFKCEQYIKIIVVSEIETEIHDILRKSKNIKNNNKHIQCQPMQWKIICNSHEYDACSYPKMELANGRNININFAQNIKNNNYFYCKIHKLKSAFMWLLINVYYPMYIAKEYSL